MILKEWWYEIKWKFIIARSFPALIHRWKKGEVNVSPYKVRTSFAQLYHLSNYGYRGRTRKIYWDAPMGIVLRCNRIPIAAIGFTIEGSCVRIVQIQGVRDKAEQLGPLRWERLLVELVIAGTRKLKYPRVEIQCAEENKYYSKYNAQTFKLRYDVTARRAGFILQPQGFHYLLLQ